MTNRRGFCCHSSPKYNICSHSAHIQNNNKWSSPLHKRNSLSDSPYTPLPRSSSSLRYVTGAEYTAHCRYSAIASLQSIQYLLTYARSRVAKFESPWPYVPGIMPLPSPPCPFGLTGRGEGGRCIIHAGNSRFLYNYNYDNGKICSS